MVERQPRSCAATGIVSALPAEGQRSTVTRLSASATTLGAPEFLRQFLQHVLPSGFQKVRHLGFMSPNSRPTIEQVRWPIALCNQAQFLLLAPSRCGILPHSQRGKMPRLQPRCAACGGPMRVVFLAAHDPPYFDTS